MKPYGFPKNERLASKKSIDKIFAIGKSLFSYPLKSIYVLDTEETTDFFAQALFVVPKKKFKKAVHRNAIRRRMREAYRLNKHFLNQWCLQNNHKINIAFIYIATDKLGCTEIEKALLSVIKQITEKSK